MSTRRNTAGVFAIIVPIIHIVPINRDDVFNALETLFVTSFGFAWDGMFRSSTASPAFLELP